MPKTKRRIKLIQPRLQLKLVFTFLGLSAFGLVFECVLFAACLSELAADLPQDGMLLLERTPEVLLKVAFVSLAGILPLVFTVGVLVTFRIAGPLYRLERFLKEILRGEKPADCTLREGDELKGFCALLNQATAPLRTAAEERGRSLDEAA